MASKRHGRGKRAVAPESGVVPSETAGAGACSRRTFLRGSAAAAVLAFMGARRVLAQAPAEELDETQKDLRSRLNRLLDEPLSLAGLDALGVVCFADAMYALIAKKDSVVQQTFRMLRLPTYNTGELDHSRGHKDKFPLENMYLAGALNAVRATVFNERVREDTTHELITAVQGVALLMGLTSVARGILTASHASEIAEANEERVAKDPEKTLADSIFQLTVVASVTQIPLTSFGNAAIGNHEFKEMKQAYATLYGRLLPSEGEALPIEAVITHVRQAAVAGNNPVIRQRVERLLAERELKTYAEVARALEEEALAHTHDLATLLMATACDDAQAAMGDPGPLIGLFQTFGMDFVHAIPTLVPFTTYIGVERAIFAARRAGIAERVITAERLAYLATFLRETWRNLLKYFATAAPNITSKIAGTDKATRTSNGGAGVDFSLLEQVLRDAESIIMAAVDAAQGSVNEHALNVRNVQEAVELLQASNREWQIKVGELMAQRVFPARVDEATVTKDELIAIQHAALGVKAKRTTPYEEGRVAELSDLQIALSRLASSGDEQAVDAFAARLNAIKREVGPELMRAIDEATREQGKRPTIVAAAKVLKENPRLKDLLDFNYWHATIGPALTDTMFVVFLQGLHMAFLISTAERVMYRASWFQSMPLMAQEQLSILVNYGLGMFADNWADTVAHSKWLATLYFCQLDKELAETLAAYPEAQAKLTDGLYDDDTRQPIPERFLRRVGQTAAFIEHLKARHPGDAAALEETLARYVENARVYYTRNMIIAMEVGVIGAGNSLPGDSTHFTYAAGEKEFTFAVTLADFKRHPLFHVYKLLFGSAYAVYVGPAIARMLGGGAQADMQAVLQGQFRKRFPGFVEKLKELEGQAAP